MLLADTNKYCEQIIGARANPRPGCGSAAPLGARAATEVPIDAPLFDEIDRIPSVEDIGRRRQVRRADAPSASSPSWRRGFNRPIIASGFGTPETNANSGPRPRWRQELERRTRRLTAPAAIRKSARRRSAARAALGGREEADVFLQSGAMRTSLGSQRGPPFMKKIFAVAVVVHLMLTVAGCTKTINVEERIKVAATRETAGQLSSATAKIFFMNGGPR